MRTLVYKICLFYLFIVNHLNAVKVGPGPDGRTCPVQEKGICFKGMPQNSNLRAMYLLDHCITTYCDTMTDGGGWIYIQRRVYKDSWASGKNWKEFKFGFGTLCTDFWLGNEFIHRMTENGTWELRIEVIHNGKNFYAVYDNFKVLSESNGYAILLGKYTGTAGNDFSNHHNTKFSTPDRDNDNDPGGHCASVFTSGWWFSNCFHSNLNGAFGSESWGRGVYWEPLTQNQQTEVTHTEMKIRRKL